VSTPVMTVRAGWDISKTQRYNTIAQETTALSAGVYVAGAMSPVFDFTMSIPLLTGRIDDVTSDIAMLHGLFAYTRGRAGTFLFPDPRDNTVTNGTFGTGDGVSKTFQLTRPLGSMANIAVQDLNGIPAIYINGSPTSLYTIDDRAVITFNTAPAAAAVLSWTGQFLFRCRFKQDTIENLRLVFENAWVLDKLEFESVNR
jgi:hypothetical protein